MLPLAFLEKDILAQAQTGSGKTAAFAIPLCQMVSWEENRPQALVLVPTRELAMQVQEETASVGKFRRMKGASAHGQPFVSAQERDLRQKAHIVIGTPGRVLDHLEQGTLATEAIRYVVLDEADEMLELGFLEQVEEILVQLPKERVTWLFSATLPEKVKRLASHYLKQPEEIKIAGEPITTQRIEQTYYDATDWDKVELLQGILTVLNPDSCLIFANTREMVDELCDELWSMSSAATGCMAAWSRQSVPRSCRISDGAIFVIWWLQMLQLGELILPKFLWWLIMSCQTARRIIFIASAGLPGWTGRAGYSAG